MFFSVFLKSLHNFDFYELQNDEKLRQIFNDLS